MNERAQPAKNVRASLTRAIRTVKCGVGSSGVSERLE